MNRPRTSRRGTVAAATAVAFAAAGLAWFAVESAGGPDPAAAAGQPAPAGNGDPGDLDERAVVPGSPVPAESRRARAATPAPGAPVAVIAAAPLVRRVRVVDRDGVPVRGVEVEGIGKDVADANTDDDGVATLSFPADVEPVAEIADGWLNRKLPLEAETTLVVVDYPQIEIVVVDVTTGIEVRAPTVEARASYPSPSSSIPLNAGVIAGKARRSHLPLGSGRCADLDVTVEPPAGFGAVTRLEWEDRYVAAQARRVRYEFPVFPAVERSFRAVDAEGRPVPGIELGDIDLVREWGSEAPSWTTISTTGTDAANPDGGATVTLRGLPALPANVVRFTIERSPTPVFDEDGSCEFPVRGPDGWRGESEDVDLSLPAPIQPLDVLVAPWDGDGAGFTCGIGCGSGRVRPWKGDPDAVGVRIRAIRADGTPAARVDLSLANAGGVTDEDGTVTLPQVRRGRALAVAKAHGFRPAVAPVVVGVETEVVLREPEARRVRVLVEDGAGRAVPGACVFARSLAVPGPDGADVTTWVTVAQLRGDLELLTPRTGPDGVVVLDLPEGRIEFTVTLAGAVERIESRDDEVRVTLRPRGSDE